MKKIYTTIIAVLAISQLSYAQYWSNGSTSTGPINYMGGNVGIGTTTPTAGKLQIDGSGDLLTLVSNTSPVQFNAYNSSDFRIIQRGNSVMTFWTNTIERLRIDAVGNVGIGITNPTSKLHVAGDIRADGGNISIGHNRPTLVVTDYEQGSELRNWDIHTASGVINFRLANDVYNAANNWMTVTRSGFVPTSISFPSGNVGIGTSNPAIKLDVQGDIGKYDPYEAKVQGLRIGSTPVYGASGARTLSLVNKVSASTSGSGGNFEKYIIKSDGFNTYLAEGAGNLIYEGTGNVGIGTTNPTTKLAVNGTIRSKEVRVEAGPWPDYVFTSTYVLPTLDQVKSYIDRYQHLPEMPSDKEVKKNGIALGEIVTLQTKKIEELTLYLIEKDKQVKQQSQQLKDQQKQLDELKAQMAKLIK